MATRHPTRPRRIDDALSQLVDSLTPPIPAHLIDPNLPSPDAEEALAAAEEYRQRQNLERAWRTIDTHPAESSSPTGLGVNRGRSGSASGGGGVVGAENINNASDLIKRKLLRENPSPDKAVRFSNLYSRLLTQPVLSQKWAILYLLYRLSDNEEDAGVEDGRRSPLMDEGNLQNLLMKGRRRVPENYSEDEGPGVSESASQIPARVGSSRREGEREEREWDTDRERELARSVNERSRESRASHGPVDVGVREKDRAVDEQQQQASAQQSFSDSGQKLTTSERGLLRDLPYNLQGLSSSNLEFASSSVLKLPPSLPIPMVSLLNTLAEPCLLYRVLANFVESSDGGLVSQSLRSALAGELRSYLGLVATLEGEIRRALAATKDSDEPKSVCKGGVTLKRCVVWTRDATMALRLMSLIVEESRSRYPLLY